MYILTPRPCSLPPSDWRLNSWRDWDLCQRNAFQVALLESYQGRGTFVPNVIDLSFQSGVYGLFFSLGLGRRQCWREERDSETLLLFNQSCPAFLRPCGPLSFGSAVHQGPLSTGILQVRTLAWIAISFSRGSLQPRGRTCISCPGRQSLDHREHLGSPPNASVLLKMRGKVGSVGAAFVSYTDPAAGACGDGAVAARTRLPVDSHFLLSVISIRTHGFAPSPVLNLVFMLDCSDTFRVHRYLFFWLKKFRKERERNLFTFYSRVPC